MNERLPDLVTNILSQKDFVSTAGYADESDEEESDRDIDAQNNQIMRDAGTQITSNRDAAAQQASNRDTGARKTTENMDADAQNCGKKKDIITPQIIRGRANDTDSQNNKSFDNVDKLLQYSNNCRRKRKHSAASSTPQRDRTPPLQMSQEILHQLGNELGMNVDESRNINQGLSTQLMHSFLHASSETSSLNKMMKLYALPSNLSKMTVLKMNEEVEITSAYQNNERFITTKEKSLYSVQNYVAKALAIISQMTDAVLNDADARENGTSLNHKKVIQMGIHATTLLSHVQADLSQRRRNNIRNIAESQYVSLCGPKPGSKTRLCKNRKILIQNICLGIT